MTAQTRAVLKTYFVKGERPTQSQYGDLIDSFQLVSGSSNYLDKSGGAMTGRLELVGVPTSALEAATKGYVDAIVSAGGAVAGGSSGQIQYNNSGGFGGFTVSGDASLATTGVLTLNNTTVSAGTYTLATVTFNAKGIATGASSGSSSTSIKTVTKQIFTSSGTYTPSAGMLYCIAEVVGGGGGSGGASSTGHSGGGGGGGYAKSWIAAATIGASQAVTIGAAGAAGTTGGQTNGGTTSLGALLQATGGVAATNVTTTTGAGGAGGIGSSGDLNISGGSGFGSILAAFSGQGGDSQYGKGGQDVATGAGNAGTGYGAGGGGAGSTSNGAAGTAGIIIITEFCTT